MSDWLTLLPPALAIIVVFWRKEVILALLVALFSSELLLMLQEQTGFASSVLQSPFQTVERIISVLSSPGNSRLLVFSLMVGALLAYSFAYNFIACIYFNLVSFKGKLILSID